MKLFDYETYEDYGKEWFFQVLRFKKFALLDLTFQWDEFPSTDFFPFLVVSMGPHHLFGFTFRWKAFEMSCDIIDAAPRNLKWYRRGEDKYELID
jgi:hypothetical protein